MQVSSASEQQPTLMPLLNPNSRQNLAARAVIKAAKANGLASNGSISITFTQLGVHVSGRHQVPREWLNEQPFGEKRATELGAMLAASLPEVDFKVDRHGEGVSSLPGQWQKYVDETTADLSAANKLPRAELQQPKQVPRSAALMQPALA